MRKLLLAIAVYVAVLAAFAVIRWNLWTYGTDTGTFAQVVRTAFGGFVDGPEQGTHFRFHWAPMLAALFPLVVVARSGLILQLAQIVLIAATALPLFGIARSYVAEGRARAYAALALLYPPLCAVAFTEFHEIAFYPALALGIVWAADRARWGWFALFAVLAAGVREEACIVLAFAGLAFVGIGIVRRELHGRRDEGLLVGTPREPERLVFAGAMLCAFNLGALGVYYGAVIPEVGAWQPSRFYEYAFAHGPVQLVLALATHPAHLAALASVGRLTYLLEALVPLAFLPLFSRWSLLALPGFAVVLLASDPIAWRMGSHYAAIWIPWLLLGTLAALVRFERERRTLRATRWYGAALALCTIFLIAIDPLHPAHYLRAVYPSDGVDQTLALVPPGAHLATHDEWFAHAAFAHPNATVFFCPYVDFALYADDYPNAYFHTEIAPEIARELASGEMRERAHVGHVHLYERTPAPGARVGACVTPGDVRYRDLPSALALGSRG